VCNISDLMVLVCDDNTDDLNSVCDILEKIGIHRLLCAENKEQFEECISRYRIDIAILDVDLAGDDGFMLGRALKKQQPGCILLFHSKTRTGRSYSTALSVGASGFIEKTVANAKQELENVLNHWAKMRAKLRSVKEYLDTTECCNGS
jgi:DNA-binding NtrC family response regulator